NHEINVTPFIDVMLVLLIIFMVPAPLATVDIQVDLPRSAATPQPRPEEPLYATIREDLSVLVGAEEVTHAELTSVHERVTESDREARVFLRADERIDYGELVTVMNLLRIAGYIRIALVGLEAAPAEPAPVSQEADE